MSLSITLDWDRADEVKTPELRETWCRLRVSVDGAVASLVRQRNSPHVIRESLDVSAYPLAEWIALNWWALATSSHVPSFAGVKLSDAGDGFPWPPLRLRSDRSQMWATLDPFIDESAQVEFLSRISTVLDSEETLLELTRFVDATVRRLDEAAITGTLLQDEWAEIRRASAEEREFATVAAAWGFDPYSMDEHVEQLLLQANATLGDSTLLAEFARTGDLSSLPKAEAWLNAAAARSFAPRQHALIETAVEPVRSIHDTVPWREGYKRARALREALGLSWSERAPVDDLVEVVSLATAPPTNVDALVRTNSMMTGAIVAPHLHAHSQRFLAARAIARRSTETGYGVSLLTRESGYSDKVERAFAAEFLAPAQGISELLGGDFGEDSQLQVATALGVSPLVISHQISNQLAA